MPFYEDDNDPRRPGSRQQHDPTRYPEGHVDNPGLPQKQPVAGVASSGTDVAQKNAAQDPEGPLGGYSYQTPPYGGPKAPIFNFPTLPMFHAPQFQVPGANGMFEDPGYQFRVNQGEKALQSSAAAQGVLRSGGTLADILKYGQASASQEYANVYDRALQAYDRTYKGKLDEYSPLLRQYELKFGASTASGLAAYQRAWDEYTFAINDAFRNKQMVFEAGVPH